MIDRQLDRTILENPADTMTQDFVYNLITLGRMPWPVTSPKTISRVKTFLQVHFENILQRKYHFKIINILKVLLSYRYCLLSELVVLLQIAKGIVGIAIGSAKGIVGLATWIIEISISIVKRIVGIVLWIANGIVMFSKGIVGISIGIAKGIVGLCDCEDYH